MALFLGNTLARDQLLQTTDASAAFYPWWDKLQNYVVYANILIGLFALPTTNSLMECAPKYPNVTSSSIAPSRFTNGFCTAEEMSLFLAFFPYALLLGPLALIIIEKFFTRSAGGLKANQMYNLIVRATSKTEDLSDWRTSNVAAFKEFQAEFRHSKSYLISYVLKNILEFLVALSFGIWLFFRSYGTIMDKSFKVVYYKECRLANVDFVCIVPNTQFYFYILIIGLCMASVYVLANLYTLLWLAFKRLRKLSRLVHTYKQELKKEHTVKWADLEAVEDVFGGLKSPDVEVLLDLLSETLGVEVALRIMALTDVEFGTMWKIFMHKGNQSVTSDSIKVAFEAPMIAKFLGSKYSKRLMYVVSLIMPDGKRKIEVFQQKNLDDLKSDLENAVYAVHHGYSSATFYAKFDDLDPGQSYSMEFSVTFDGKEVSEHVYHDILTCPGPPRKLKSSWSLAVEDNDILYNFNAQWDASRELTYVVELIDTNDKSVVISTAKGAINQKSTNGRNLHELKIWSIDKLGQKSDNFMIQPINPAPKLMRKYVKYLKEKVSNDGDFEKDMNEYLFKVTLLEKMSRELKRVQEGLQMAVALTNLEQQYENEIDIIETGGDNNEEEDDMEMTTKSLELNNLFEA